MTEDFLNRMYQLLDYDPESHDVTQFINAFKNDPELVQTWHDFLVEEYLSGATNEAWRKYIQSIPQLKQQIEFQTQIQQGIRTIGEKNTRAEIREILPKRNDDGIKKIGRGPRFIVFAIAIAAVALLCIGVMIRKFWVDSGIITGEGGVPIVMIEEIDAEAIPEENLGDRILQRIPAKLTAATGICPVTHYAVGHATDRAKVNETPQEIVNANYSMQSKVRREGGGYVVNASFVNLVDNRSLWKKSFTVEDNPKAFDDLQDELSLRIVNSLRLKLSADARIRMVKDISDHPEAMHFFLEGEKQLAERTDSSLPAAIKLFQTALEYDTASTIIHGYLALAYATYAENDYGDSSDWQKAVMHAQKTLVVDPNNAEALVVLGSYASTVEKDYRTAAGYFDNALQIQPGDAKVHQAIAELHLRTGDIPLGKEHIQIARVIEPEHRVVRWIETMYLTASGMLEVAKEAADDLKLMHPTYKNIKIFDWQYHLCRKEYTQALDAIPEERSEEAKKYFRSFVYLEQKNFSSYHALYPMNEEHPKSLVLLEHIQKGEWNEAYTLLERLLIEDDLHLLAWFQIADFEMFNNMKQDPEIRRILLEAGIKVNIIPKEVHPEI